MGDAAGVSLDKEYEADGGQSFIGRPRYTRKDQRQVRPAPAGCEHLRPFALRGRYII